MNLGDGMNVAINKMDAVLDGSHLSHPSGCQRRYRIYG
jgi:hypothetical protein